MAIEAALERLEVVLSRRRPNLFVELSPGITERDLDALPPLVVDAIHPDLLELYRWRNGHPRDSDGGPFQNHMDFCSLQESSSAYLTFVNLADHGEFGDWKDWWNPGWFPFLHGPSGDHLCVDAFGSFSAAPGQLIDFIHNDESRDVVAPSLASWIEGYCRLLEEDTLDEFACVTNAEGYVWTKGIPGFPKAQTSRRSR
jgi:cell wall assembly regulator SMI1